jgi:5-methylthioadenosine/S-adenosylhomocysteine deaminase
MRVGLLIQRGIRGERGFYSAKTFVRLATIEGARALKLDHLIGSLEPGKRADIIAVDLSQSYQTPTQDPYGALVHTCHQEDVLMTMVDGRILFDRGTFHTVDPEPMRARVEEMRLKVRG